MSYSSTAHSNDCLGLTIGATSPAESFSCTIRRVASSSRSSTSERPACKRSVVSVTKTAFSCVCYRLNRCRREANCCLRMQLLSYYLQSVRGQVITFAPPAVKPLAPYITDNVSGGMMAYATSFQLLLVSPLTERLFFAIAAHTRATVRPTTCTCSPRFRHPALRSCRPCRADSVSFAELAWPLPSSVRSRRSPKVALSVATDLYLCLAGAYALLMSARKSDAMTPVQARALMMSTSVQVPSTFRGSTLDTVTLQGAGTYRGLLLGFAAGSTC